MRVEQITFTRFVAAISIVIYHFAMSIYPFQSEAVSFLFAQANLGVSFFFLLSGFVMIIAYGGKKNTPVSASRFYLNRVARVYPAFFFALILLVIYMIVRKRQFTMTEFFLNLAIIQTWFPRYALSLNTPGWSLAVEFFFYALFPFLFNRIYSKVPVRKLIFPIVFFWILTQVFFNIMIQSPFYKGYPSDSHNLLYYFPLMHLNEFLIGNLGGIILLHMGERAKRNYTFLWLLTLCVLIGLLRFPLPWSYHDGLLAIVFIPFVLLLSLDTGFFSRFFSLKPMVFLGEISYGIYIFQVPVYFWMKGMMTYIGITNPYLVFYIFLAGLLGISSLSYLYVEAPLKKFVRNLNFQGVFSLHKKAAQTEPGRISVLLIEEGSSIITLRVLGCLGITNQYRIHILSFSGKQIPSFRHSRYISSYETCDLCSEEEALQKMLQTAQSVRADIVMPLMEKQSKIISQNAFLFKGICKLPLLPDQRTIELVINKYLLSQWLCESGFSPVRTHNISTLREQEHQVEELSFPLLVKPFWGSSGEGIVRIDEPAGLRQILDTNPEETNKMIMPFIHGSDIDFSALVDNGKVRVYTIQRPAVENRRFKYSKKIEFIHDPALTDLCERIFEKLNYSGIAHLDFRYDPVNRSYTLVDFNARYWSTLNGSLRAGVNFPHIACQEALKRNIPSSDYRMIQFLSSENLFYILLNSFSLKRKTLGFLFNNELCYGMRDPLPMAFNFVNLIKGKTLWIMNRRR
jgi:peptidoglycan/LPS O-acetylase OafA/YrhL/predicted ATP-grasp superfamily ATP-dependent carboligase